ncbi:EAL domain-containing protein [Sphingomonas glaciei]|uniref:EAL domain-containing protein n=1 Tax=Sphingomonas glaciei TaxID=2938948 RepID=A0ABY5N202_9SPHN|nr:EAL domain-containing protein [Sphingomonas glaciei]UUR08611.1 EAL domain-containing protein [Sphingomonas glaciei]
MNKDDVRLLDELERALRHGELRLAYQPKVDAFDGSLIRVEALMRWTHEEMGVISPARFVPLAEQHGLIDGLTQWALRTALRQLRVWNNAGLDTSVAVNISAMSLEQLDFPDLVERMCRALNVPTDRLVLELTEGATQPLINLMDTLTRFRIKGVGLALDDFGTGYSGLIQLRKLPFNEIKIDRQFVTDLPTSRDDQVIVRSVIELAHGLGLQVTAEGVETVEQLAALRDLRCDLIQGYLVAHPLEAGELVAWASRHKRRWKLLIRPPQEEPQRIKA